MAASRTRTVTEFVRRWNRAGNANYLPTVRVWANTHGLLTHVHTTNKVSIATVIDAAVTHYAREVLKMSDEEIQSIEHRIGYVPNKMTETTSGGKRKAAKVNKPEWPAPVRAYDCDIELRAIGK